VRAARSPRKEHTSKTKRGEVLWDHRRANPFGTRSRSGALDCFLRGNCAFETKFRFSSGHVVGVEGKTSAAYQVNLDAASEKGSLRANLFDNVANDRIERAAYDDVGTLWISPKEIGV
jgi:hypothetical protein